MDKLYPAGPSAVPMKLTAPSAAYRRQSWLAVAGLMTFAVAYLGLTGWFGWTAWRMIRTLLAGDGGDGLSNVLVAACATLLTIFMVKGLVSFEKKKKSYDGIELMPADQPELFSFLHRLADDARAPRPHRVFLSPRVNAGVFYDLSLFNLIFPSKKNLDIGLSLMNVLNLGEFKAVLAHEFGHFAQRTMAVGRWVYVAHQVAARLIAKRDALDTMLSTLSRMDFRIAWIGWALSLIIWAIRSLVEAAFRIVILSERALSREMEYQADLVAASLTGSDALVHALHRLGAGDEAWNRALAYASREHGRGRAVEDLFAVQTRVIELMRRVAPHTMFAETPPIPEEGREQHRVFRSELAKPPQMWSTHPSNSDREKNIKRHYVVAEIDSRPAMVLLHDAEGLKRRLSREMLVNEPPSFAPIEETLIRLDAEYERRSLDLRYRGTYLNRSFVRDVNEPSDLVCSTADALDDAQLLDGIDQLYPAAHGDALLRLEELQQERTTLEATRLGQLRAPGDVINWRGRQLSRRQLRSAIAELDAEIVPLRKAVSEHDRQCRSLHLSAARRVGAGWEALLFGQLELLHYCDHVAADLRDLHAVFANTFQVVTADGSVSKHEFRRLLNDGDRLYNALGAIYDRAVDVVVDETVAARMEQGFVAGLGRLSLGRPTAANINDWLRLIDNWVNHTCTELTELRSATLDALLTHEDEVAAQLRTGERSSAPAASGAPRPYPVLLSGQERRRQTRLGWWDRFQSADGWAALMARVVIGGCIVSGVLMLGMHSGLATVSLYNGLARTVDVEIDGHKVRLAPLQNATLSVDAGRAHQITTRTSDGIVIEAFDSEDIQGQSHFVYNVAGAAPLVQWTATYGDVQPSPQNNLGAARWSSSSADFVFTTPPESISTGRHEQGGRRSVLSAGGELAPPAQLSLVANADEAKALIQAHARWDDASSRHLSEWLWISQQQVGTIDDLIAERVQRDPHDVATLRIEQSLATGPAHDMVCAKHRAMAESEPGFVGYAYLATRCLADGPEQDRAFIEGQKRWPEHPWFALAAGYVHAARQQWSQADALWSKAMQAPETAESVGSELVRVKRAMDAPHDQWLALAAQSSYMTQMLQMTTAEAQGTPYAAYGMLDHGDLEGAIKQAEGDADLHARMVRMVAASDGASRELVQRALSLGADEGIDSLSAWTAWALAMREGRSYEVWKQRVLADADSEGAQVANFIDVVLAGASQGEAEAALGQVSPRTRGLAYSMVATLRGYACPQQWREASKKLLLTPERPYFR